MKDTVSFFFLGTDCHRSNYQDAMTVFHNAVASNANKADSTVATHLFDGVGSVPDPTCAEHPTPGRYVYDPVSNRKVRVTDEILAGIKDTMKGLTGRLLGDGMDDLLFEATLFLQQIINNNNGEMPKTVNLHGYSRGADACVRLANLLDTLYPDVKVNLFLVDHVPGPGRANDPNSYTIPRNVQRLDTALMLHEYKPGFDPQDRNRYVFASPHTTKVSIKVYPGWHGKAMLLTPNEETNHVPKLLHDDFYRFCRETDSLDASAPIPSQKIVMDSNWKDFQDKEGKELTPQERFEHYNEMQSSWWFYSKGTALNTRTILTNYKHYTQDPRLFVNQEHGELFEKLYPNIYKRFYGGEQVTETIVRAELDKLKSENEGFYNKLCHVHKITAGPLPAPRKVVHYFRRPLGATLIDDERSFLEQAIITVINYEKHLKENNSETIKFAVRSLEESLEETESLTDAEAIPNLKRKIQLVSKFLEVREHQKSYLYGQLDKVCHTFEYIDKVQSLLNSYLEHSSLHLKQKELIQHVLEELDAIKDDTNLNYMERMKAAKSKVMGLSLALQVSSDHDDVFMHDTMRTAYYYFSKEKHTLPNLLRSINELNAPGYSETSVAKDIAKKFEGYYKLNTFLENVHRVLSTVIELPRFTLPKKTKLAFVIYNRLNALDTQGHGNDLNEISKILAQGQQDLHKKYQKHYPKSGKIATGTFDKIMVQAQGQLNREAHAFLVTDVKQEVRPNI
ncbi:DUF5621 domain-containing protein [Fluoribacter dumoffii]|uniref:DUF5621 domain-containing protein n=1 Tax=Fluoribacter dumoffii TaxID=463 RepID=UPI0022447C33|nr:DUF5621 domain-containing protein [Fluoribacter dumoffii]MCW8385140.1 DUF5621 domain-containing protein [Fluoribacter dumoffii]MCW8496562.1 DUF5621 domain-containing protein [Fluoribacter dumoffii]